MPQGFHIVPWGHNITFAKPKKKKRCLQSSSKLRRFPQISPTWETNTRQYDPALNSWNLKHPTLPFAGLLPRCAGFFRPWVMALEGGSLLPSINLRAPRWATTFSAIFVGNSVTGWWTPPWVIGCYIWDEKKTTQVFFITGLFVASHIDTSNNHSYVVVVVFFNDMIRIPINLSGLNGMSCQGFERCLRGKHICKKQ